MAHYGSYHPEFESAKARQQHMRDERSQDRLAMAAGRQLPGKRRFFAIIRRFLATKVRAPAPKPESLPDLPNAAD
jgi:hypothetical protein